MRRAEESESASQRLRARFGLTQGNSVEAEVRDWMVSSGALPTTLACAALAIYLVITLISAVS